MILNEFVPWFCQNLKGVPKCDEYSEGTSMGKLSPYICYSAYTYYSSINYLHNQYLNKITVSKKWDGPFFVAVTKSEGSLIWISYKRRAILFPPSMLFNNEYSLLYYSPMLMKEIVSLQRLRQWFLCITYPQNKKNKKCQVWKQFLQKSREIFDSLPGHWNIHESIITVSWH